MSASDFTFLWHDYETFGADPRRDRPCQFAALRTDAALNPLDDGEMFFCQPADDYIPHPQAVLITGITPQQARREGLPESDFAARINALMSQPNTCVVGYNSLRFDDEVTRHLLYRNLMDPYAREWQQGNSRWDLIDVVRAFYALRPEGINWPRREDGTPSFRLEDLTAANGIEHGSAAHDALADVRATIALARLLRQAQPRLFDYLLQQRGKQQVAALLPLQQPRPVVHVSSRFPAAQGCTSLVVPLAAHPTNPNGVIVYDLSTPPDDLLNLSAEDIRERLYTRQEMLQAAGKQRVPLKLVHLNRCPVILPLKVMQPAIAERLGLNLQQQERHWQQLAAALNQELVDRLQQVFAAGDAKDSGDPDLMLYSGPFLSRNDQQTLSRIRACAPEQLGDQSWVFEDARLEEMLFRFRARNWPEYLTSSERIRWDEYRWQRMNSSALSSVTLQDLEVLLPQLYQQLQTQEQAFLLEELQLWVQSILPEQALF